MKIESKNTETAQKQWMVIKTNPRAEKKVNERLETAGFTTFLPLETVMKVWSDRKKKIEQPLIASTLFVETTPKLINDVYGVSGVRSVLKFLGKPAVVQAYEIENLRILLNQSKNNKLEPVQHYKKGELVKVVRGPFKGLTANVLESHANFRLVVEIESVSSGFEVDVPKSCVEKWIRI